MIYDFNFCCSLTFFVLNKKMPPEFCALISTLVLSKNEDSDKSI